MKLLDLTDKLEYQTIIDKDNEYLGHPSSVMLDDNKTIFIAYPKGHGRGEIVLKKSSDFGYNWSGRLSTPKTWKQSKETPTLFKLDHQGIQNLILWSGKYPSCFAISKDSGNNWSEFKSVNWGGIVVMSSLIKINDGKYIGFFHDNGRFLKGKNTRDLFRLYKSYTEDGGLSWSYPEEFYTSDQRNRLCEPGAFLDPSNNRLILLLRNHDLKSRTNSFIMYSDDFGTTWSRPTMLNKNFTGDRHVVKYFDSKLLISFRSKWKGHPYHHDWVVWYGTYDMLINNKVEGLYIRLKKNYPGGRFEGDCAYPTIEINNDKAFLATYGHWEPKTNPYILGVHLTQSELNV